MKLYEILLRTTSNTHIAIVPDVEYKYFDYIYYGNIRDMSISLLQQLYINDFEVKEIYDPIDGQAILYKIAYKENKDELIKKLIETFKQELTKDKGLYKRAFKVIAKSLQMSIEVDEHRIDPLYIKYSFIYQDNDGNDIIKYISKKEYDLLHKAFEGVKDK